MGAPGRVIGGHRRRPTGHPALPNQTPTVRRSTPTPGWLARLRCGPVDRAEVFHWCMARTNVDIDEQACAEVMRRHGFTTKRDAINYALRREARRMSLDEALAMRGSGWDGDLDAMRAGNRPAPW
ncbi:MAG: type II toxin-antitoxin system VapB family antitoxin [Microthrixaceae bacterium]